jgi:hypothetical protein
MHAEAARHLHAVPVASWVPDRAERRGLRLAVPAATSHAEAVVSPPQLTTPPGLGRRPLATKSKPGQGSPAEDPPARVGYPARVDRSYPLNGLLVCDSCDLSLRPLESTDGRRCYRSPCGCRLSPVDAEAVERQTYNALDHSGLLPIESVFDPTEAARLFMLALVAVRVGAVPEELAYIWRI